MNRSSDTDAARFGFEAGHDAGWKAAIAAAAASLIDQGQPAGMVATMIRQTRSQR